MIAVDWRPHRLADCLVLTPRGELDATTVWAVRDDLVAYALERPRAIIVVVDDLVIGSSAALGAFSSAWQRTATWPAVPISLVAGDQDRHAALTGSPVADSVPVHASLDAAMAKLGDAPPRRRAGLELAPVGSSSHRAREFVRATCERWDLSDRAPQAVMVATELVENSISHAATDFRLELEPRDGGLVVAVRDGSPRPATLLADGRPGGLRVVEHLATEWGCASDSVGGKVVWAVLA